MKYLLCIFLIYCCCVINAQSTTGSPYFELSGKADFPLENTTADVNIAGVIADVTVSQTYVNNGTERLEATYVFPGSTNAAVYGMTMIVGSRRIAGIIQRKAEARETYEAAKAEGKRASLLEQHRPNVFQMNVANILPGDTVKVELKYTELLVPESGTYRFVYPTVVGPRFTGESEPGTTAYAAQPYVNGPPTYAFDIDINLNAGMSVSNIGSPSHRLAITPSGTSSAITTDGSETYGGNRDFVLEYQLQGKQIQTGMLLFEGEKENYFLYMAQPPQAPTDQDYPPREFVFVVDVSGSMNGFPLQVSKKLLRKLIGQLRPTDQFNVVLFAGASQTWQASSLAATEDNLSSALTFLDQARGGGGTQLLRALQTAYALPRVAEGLSRNFVVVTDGYISVEPEVFDLVRKNLNQANVYSFGIGSGVNRHLIEGMARIGKGRPAFVLNPSQADTVADKFRRYISEPVLTEMELDFGDKFEAYDIEPTSLPDVSRERPLVVFGKYRGKAKGQLKLTGYGGYAGLENQNGIPADQIKSEADTRKRQYTFKLKGAIADARNAALAQLWARERIRRLDDYNNLRHNDARVEEVTQLGLDYNLLTQYTSFVAVEETPVADVNDPLKTVKQPLPLPENVSATAVGFTLGFAGVAGLPVTGGTPWYAFAIIGLLAGALCYLLYTVFGRRLFFVLIPFALFSLLISCDASRKQALARETTPEILEDPLAFDDRAATITFILGEDEGTNAYYTRATEYFRYHPQEAGEYLVTELRSISEVHDYLQRNQSPAGFWRKVNLVAHGNQWTGLATPLHPGQATRTSTEVLSAWEPARELPETSVNEQTEIIVHGCSVGRDSALLLQLSRVFAARGHQFPAVAASENFTLFREGEYGMERHYAEYYFRATPLGKYPQKEVMANRFARQHPDKPIDWDEALSNSRFTEELQPHLYQFNVPVSWTRVYPQNLKTTVPTNEAAWLAGEPDLMARLERMGLSPRQFLWDFSAEDYQLADGGTIPAVTAKGVARLFCVLVPVPGEDQMVRVRYGV
ncbi:VIT and vWA domain-containing protein [Neolewinella persica]|uniref:VIT and vWA domain-containing protein n=1 Tax=Neolewinella persica TaxID=70998 RepID=UPI000374DFC2|nr:VIT and VWA domain-containing protein [Neolewinella persica]